jgi:hypothetical protein
MKRIAIVLLLAFGAVAPRSVSSAGTASPAIEQFLTPGMPIEMVSAKRVDRLAWTAYEHGRRNVYTASAPGFAPVRLTHVTKDDGLELSDISMSDNDF